LTGIELLGFSQQSNKWQKEEKGFLKIHGGVDIEAKRFWQSK
jgi:hypothetical protein